MRIQEEKFQNTTAINVINFQIKMGGKQFLLTFSSCLFRRKLTETRKDVEPAILAVLEDITGKF
jgi:hypothetical protein